MTIELHLIAWNESRLLPFVLAHYAKFCTSMVVYDNHSDDGTQDIARSYGATVVPFGKPGQLNDEEYLKIKNHCWKRSRADWVIVCDADEVLHHPYIKDVLGLATDRFHTIFDTLG